MAIANSNHEAPGELCGVSAATGSESVVERWCLASTGTPDILDMSHFVDIVDRVVDVEASAWRSNAPNQLAIEPTVRLVDLRHVPNARDRFLEFLKDSFGTVLAVRSPPLDFLFGLRSAPNGETDFHDFGASSSMTSSASKVGPPARRSRIEAMISRCT